MYSQESQIIQEHNIDTIKKFKLLMNSIFLSLTLLNLFLNWTGCLHNDVTKYSVAEGPKAVKIKFFVAFWVSLSQTLQGYFYSVRPLIAAAFTQKLLRIFIYISHFMRKARK